MTELAWRLRPRESTEQLLEPERLADRPGLELASARGVRLVGIRDLRKVAQAAIVFEMHQKRREKLLLRLLLRLSCSPADANPRFDECAHQPRPHRPLMVRTVTVAHAALITRRVSILAGSKRSQSYRRQQPRFDRVDDAARTRALKHREG